VESIPRLLIGSLHSEYVLVTPVRREFPEATDYWDGNWIDSKVTLRVGGFTGAYDAQFRVDEFASFRDQLRPLYEALRGEARFESMETSLKILVTGDGLGHLAAECVACDQPGTGNRLSFELAFDQTELQVVLGDLEALLRVFPVKGRP
jgi:hypothetical protein